MKAILIVGLGSFLGGSFRYLISLLLQNKLQVFPWNTFAVNLAGCFLIGLVYGMADRNGMSDSMKLFLGTGLLGGFTTFSAFSMESLRLLQLNLFTNAILYILCSLILGLGLTYLGYLLVVK